MEEIKCPYCVSKIPKWRIDFAYKYQFNKDVVKEAVQYNPDLSTNVFHALIHIPESA